MGVLSRLPWAVAGVLPGVALGTAAVVAGLLRRDKPLHPIGHHATGRLTVTHPVPEHRIELLAQAGTHPCELRWSRSMGLPRGWPDIEGMALRLPGAAADGGSADVLFASTGAHTWSRYLLTVRGHGNFGRLTTLLPVLATDRPVTFMLTPEGASGGDLPPASYTLHIAGGTGPWKRVGLVEAVWSEADTTDRFDPITHQLAGIEQHPLVAALREPAYVAARAVTTAGRADRRSRAAAPRAGHQAPGASR